MSATVMDGGTPTLRRSQSQRSRTDSKSDDRSYEVDKEKDAYETVVVDPADDSVDNHVIQKAEEVATHILSTRDEPDAQVITFRSVFLGFGLSAFSAVLATIYTFKPQNATVSQLFCLIIAYVLGTAMHTLMPAKGYWKYLNPGPFNIKEHTAIVIMASTASQVSTTMEVIAALDLFYDIRLNSAVAMFQIFATQMVGYGVAGLLRTFLVYPTYAFYPTYISVVNLLQSLHFGGALNLKRRRFFWIVFAAIFAWEWIPQYPFPLLTAISIICLVDNGRSSFVRNLFGAGSSNEGIGLFSFGLSWTLITQGNPLVWPLQTQINSYLGMLLGYLLLTTCYYSNIFSGRDLPWMSTSLFSANGSTYDQSAVLTPDYRLNRTAVGENGEGLPRYTTTYAISQLSYNLSVGAAVTSLFLWHWPEMKKAFGGMAFLKRGHADIDDPHYKEMQKYPEVPQYVYGLVFLISIAIGIGCSYATPTGVVLIPGWSVVLFTAFAFIISIFLGFVTATTGFNLSIKYAVQIIASFIHPGQPITVMYANLYGNASAFQTLYMLQDLKLGQYTKLPPRMTFVAQMAGSIVGSIFNFTMMNSIVSANRDVLRDPIGTRVWSGWNIQSLNSSAIAMGAFGHELFTFGKMYWMIPFGLFLGLFAPFPFWIAYKLSKPESKLARTAKYFNMPILLQYMGYLPYSVNGQWWSCFVIGMISQWYIRTRKPKWFAKYNYLLSAALDGGSQVILFILSFAVFGASGKAVDFPFWWGNPENLSVDRCKATD
ncbi:OPT oligopeptide transporter [Dendrothele bispora CBS 962.96]|uniref:OPT oligopeptide transporter n=1 Tax=Dendrothele bispora (strain CBS 962.96) TaxID=1314807 RepID=A0A4S8KNX9_DENBC|nr:OPT oligopeptide transporter [Dendrothele bispora CBS 962.96]